MEIIKSGSTIGIIGGGQLGKMSAESAKRLGYKTHIYCPKDGEPATLVSDKKTIAEYDDVEALKKFSDDVDVITFEFENIPAKSVKLLEETNIVRPNWKVLEISQNRFKEKNFIQDLGIKVAPFSKIENAYDLENAMNNSQASKSIIKTAEMGYDGKGQATLDKNSNFNEIWNNLDTKIAILEEFVPFDAEISVIVARKENSKTSSFPPAKNTHDHGILDISIAPSGLDNSIEEKAQSIAKKISDSLDLIGIIAVEFFVLGNELFVNEIAPRPHNSGHWTMDGCETSQFEQFIRAICGIEFKNTNMIAKKVTMKNLIGDDVNNIEALKKENSIVHLYGKKDVKKGRKMGHINYLEYN